MKYTKNRISRRSRVKQSRKTKYSSSKRKNNLKTKIQRGGDLSSEQKEKYITHLQTYLSNRKRVGNSEGKIIFNKYDLQLIALFIWANELYDSTQQRQLNDFLVSQSPFTILANILPDLFRDKGQQNYIVVSSSSSKPIEKDYNAANLNEWVDNPKTDGLILNKKRFLEIINSVKINGSINITNLNKFELQQGAFKYKDLNLPNSSSQKNTEPIHGTLHNLGLMHMSQMIPSHRLTHMWFKGWPDHDVPEDKTQFIKFIKEVYKDIKDNGGTTLIHCSAGVGRTGVVYLVLKLMFKYNFNLLDNKDELGEYSGSKLTNADIIRELKEARNNRMKLVQTIEQFKFIMDVFNLSHKNKKEKEKEKEIKEYIDIPKESNATTIVGEMCSKEKKNRYQDILPYNDTRVILHNKDVLPECNQYINASNMEPDAFGKGRNVITAQCPTESTKDDFINMLNNEKVKRIVMVTNLVEKSVDKCYDYTGQLTNDTTNPDYTTYYNVFSNRLEKLANPVSSNT